MEQLLLVRLRSGQGAISESWHVDHTRQQDATVVGRRPPVPA